MGEARLILPLRHAACLRTRGALQIHPSAVKTIHPADGTVMTDLKEVREIVYRLQRPAIAPKYVYPHDWAEGDLVLFHTVVGAFARDEVRIFRQRNMASSEGVTGPDLQVY